VTTRGDLRPLTPVTMEMLCQVTFYVFIKVSEKLLLPSSGRTRSTAKRKVKRGREDMNRDKERTNSKGRHSIHTAPTRSLVASVFLSLKSLSRADYFHPEHGSRKYFRNIRKLITLHGVISQKTKYQFPFASLPGMDAHYARI
jgi:hypothetical protein